MTDPPPPPASVGPPTDLAAPAPPPRRWDWRPKVRWFAAEYLIVVLGVLTAVGINAWWQDQQDATGEASYLALIARDLDQMMDELDELRAYEESQAQNGLAAYRLLSDRDRSPEAQATVSASVRRLTQRRTMRVTNPAYQDLLSTGNLQLIRNAGLRDQVIAFYEQAEREFEIHNLNNVSYVDEMFKRATIGGGLFMLKNEDTQVVASVSTADSLFATVIAGGYADAPDPIWRLPDESQEWMAVRGQVLARIRTALSESRRASALIEDLRAVQEAVHAERNS